MRMRVVCPCVVRSPFLPVPFCPPTTTTPPGRPIRVFAAVQPKDAVMTALVNVAVTLPHSLQLRCVQLPKGLPFRTNSYIT